MCTVCSVIIRYPCNNIQIYFDTFIKLFDKWNAVSVDEQWMNSDGDDGSILDCWHKFYGHKKNTTSLCVHFPNFLTKKLLENSKIQPELWN